MIIQKLLNLTMVGAEWVIWFLIILSILSVAIMAERAYTFYKKRTKWKTLGTDVIKLLETGDKLGAITLLKNSNSYEAAICLSTVENRDKNIPAIEEIIIATTNDIKLKMEKNVAFLGTVGSNAPFIGLFGTVLGIIKAFHDLSVGTKEGATAVMAGISEALVATAIGLLVAIPAVIAYNYFQRKIKTTLLNAESLNRLILAYLKNKKD